MTTLVTPDEMRAAEARAVAAGRAEPDLMHEAASLIAEWIDVHVQRRASARRFAVAIVGPGNNGGDALVALAMLIARGWRCASLRTGSRRSSQLPISSSLLDQIETANPDTLEDADVILDGVYGVGGRASLPDDVSELFERARAIRIDRGTPLVAIDVPSGVDPANGSTAPSAFQADVTLCLGLPKVGLVLEPAASCVGELEILDIGIPSPVSDDRPALIDERTVRRILPRRNASAHKHQTGTVLVIGGAPTYYGAPRLSAESAARSGAGLVCVASPSSIVPVIAGQVPELTFLPLDESPTVAVSQVETWITRRSGHVDAIVAGPGLGQSPHAWRLLQGLFGRSINSFYSSRTCESSMIPMVLDADALNWISSLHTFPCGISPGQALMTPHVGEMSRLLGVSTDHVLRDPIGNAMDAAQRFKQTVLLKTGYSVIATDTGRVWISPRSAPELATAGTGDVLAGLAGGMLAQGLSVEIAAVAALFVGARSGKLARRKYGVHGVLAHDVIEQIPNVLRVLAEPDWDGDDMGRKREEL